MCQAARSCLRTYPVLQHPLLRIFYKSMTWHFKNQQVENKSVKVYWDTYIYKDIYPYNEHLVLDTLYVCGDRVGKKVLGNNMKSANPDKSAYKCSMPHSNFGSKLKGIRDILTREITCIPCPGKIGQQPQTRSVLRNCRNGPGEKKPATPGPRTDFFFAVVWIKWMNIFRPAYFTPRHLRGGAGG